MNSTRRARFFTVAIVSLWLIILVVPVLFTGATSLKFTGTS